MQDNTRPGFVQDLINFFRRAKHRRKQSACSTIIEQNKNIERYKEKFPITDADYTQHRWRASNRSHHRKKSSDTNTAADTTPHCSCQIVRAFTKAKELGDETVIQQVKDGTYVPTGKCEHVLASERSENSKKVRRCKSDVGRSALNRNNSKRNRKKTDRNCDEQGDVSAKVATESADITAATEQTTTIQLQGDVLSRNDALPVDIKLEDTPYDQTILSFSDLDKIESYHEENENTINHLALQRKLNSRKNSLRQSVRRKLEKFQWNSEEQKLKKKSYKSLGTESDSDVEALIVQPS